MRSCSIIEMTLRQIWRENAYTLKPSFLLCLTPEMSVLNIVTFGFHKRLRIVSLVQQLLAFPEGFYCHLLFACRLYRSI